MSKRPCLRKTMFVADSEGEMTQVEFWSSYKGLFTPYQDRVPLLPAPAEKREIAWERALKSRLAASAPWRGRR